LQTQNYVPFVLLIESVTIPINDSKSKILSSVGLFIIILNQGKYPFVELIVCEIVLALMIYNIFFDSVSKNKNELAFSVFHFLLLIYLFRNVLMIYFYYTDQIYLMNNYSPFLITIIIIPILIAYSGPGEKIKIRSNNLIRIPIFKINSEVPNLNLIQTKIPESFRELTKTEIRVLSLLAEGHNSKEICELMFISKRTVYFHLQNIKGKLNIDSTTRLTKFAIENRDNFVKIHQPAFLNSAKN
jgi:DNA-binding CsgD family transcriptional regulator